MKKTILLVIALVLLCCGVSFAIDGFNTWSPAKTADAVIIARPAYLMGILITPDGTNACKVDLHNHASAAAGDYLSFNVAAGEAGTTGFLDNDGGYYNQGIYANVTIGGGGSCTFSVKYR